MMRLRPLLTIGGLLASLVLTKAQVDFDCPEPDGLFPHPEQCDRYFECKNYRVSRKLCADGLGKVSHKISLITNFSLKHKF